MTALYFIATEFDFDPEDDDFLAMVFLKGTRGSVREYLCLTRFTDEQDDGRISIEVSEQTRQTYDGIVRCTLALGGLSLELTEEARRALGTSSVAIGFALEPELFDRLHAALRSIFRDRKGVLVLV